MWSLVGRMVNWFKLDGERTVEDLLKERVGFGQFMDETWGFVLEYYPEYIVWAFENTAHLASQPGEDLAVMAYGRSVDVQFERFKNGRLRSLQSDMEWERDPYDAFG